MRSGVLKIAVYATVLGASELAAEDHVEGTMTAAELAALERENELWRLVDPRLDLARNLERWRAKGALEIEIAPLRPRLADICEVEVDRQFGWLPGETVERLQAIDAEYTIRLRAARLFTLTGVRPAGIPVNTTEMVRWHWQRELLQALGEDEYAEFRLMNSPSARQLRSRTRELRLSEAEWRTLCEWQREFDLAYGAGRGGETRNPRDPGWREQAAWDLEDRVRDLLGDERCATYLASADEEFRMQQASLVECGGATPTAALELRRLRRQLREERSRTDNHLEIDRLAARIRDEVRAALGEEVFLKYCETPAARWLTWNQRIRQRGSR